MDPPSPTWIYSNNVALQEEMRCPKVAVVAFYDTMGRQIWLGNAMLLASAALTGVLVGIGSGYGRRYRHHRFTRFIFLGANILFLPIISFVVSTLRDSSNDYVNKEDGTTLAALCNSVFHPCMVITWAFLVQMAATNATSVVATESREGQKVGPPWELLVKGIWTFYLGASITNKRFFHGLFRISSSENHRSFTIICSKIMFAPFALICAKIWFKCYSFRKARKSFALGRNPCLVFGYMKELQQVRSQHDGTSTVGEDALFSPLLVMGEDSRQVKKQPWGYVFSDIWTMAIDRIGLVTLDRVWKLDSVAPTSKELCLSFALFKLLRCRFARYDIANAVGSTGHKFFWSLLLKDGEHNRVFRVIADELSFVHDYYNSSLPTSYAKCWLPFLSILISLLSVGYCVVAAYFIVVFAGQVHKYGRSQIHCDFWCSKLQAVSQLHNKNFGNLYFDVLPEFLLLILVLVAEVRDITSYISSNWTKVALICHHVKCASLQHQQTRYQWFGPLLRCRCKLVNNWDEKIGQCSVLVLHPTTRTNFIGLLSRVLHHLPDEKMKVNMPEAVKACIMDSLRSTASNSTLGQVGNVRTFLQRSGQAGTGFLWACNGKMSTSDMILTWHIATSIFEVRHPYWDDIEQGSSPVSIQHKSAATHLSRYCAYLMTWSPELLPDEVAWTKSLYEAVKEDTEHVLNVRAVTGPPLMPEAEYNDLVQLLREKSNHLVVKNGVRLGKQLVELGEGEETAWAILAGFWAEMILYVAPSNNLKGHKKAIARGGELITLLWALLFHAGIVSRPGEAASAAGSAVGV
ncbi:hypothetical protein BDA96_02G025600 [Sorghum bicolor]|uniref:DUF4220 domain-containing protein n=2 Tax=Sorghum bicolor TaxID=4558 RepID=A0A921RM15_SORBI|nr:hypothetical protein BDA96_02G025600 [Sorghum bicolor]